MVYRIGIIVHRRFRMHKRRRCAQTARLPPVSGRSVLQFWFWSRSSGFESLFPSKHARGRSLNRSDFVFWDALEWFHTGG